LRACSLISDERFAIGDCLARSIVSQDITVIMGAFGLGEVLPLGQPVIYVFAGFLAGKGEFFGVGDAVDPDGFTSENFANENGEEPRRGPGCDDGIWPDSNDAPGYTEEAEDEFELSVAIGVDDRTKLGPVNFGFITTTNSSVGNVGTFEGGA